MPGTVADVMDKNPCVIRDSTTLSDVATILAHKGESAVLLSDERGGLTGIYTETDMAHALIDRIPDDTPIRTLMTKSPQFVEPEATLEECSALMTDFRVRHLPVCTSDRIVGMVGILAVKREIADQLTDHVIKLKRRDEFLSIAAHDIRAPIGVIQTCCELAAMSEGIDSVSDELKELLGRMRSNAEKALKLVNDLLDIGRLNTGLKLELKSVAIVDLLEKIAANERIMASEKSVAIKVVGDRAIRAQIDPDRYEEIIVNLVTNAIKFTKSETTITLGAEVRGENLRVSVQDQGPGIPKDKAESVFRKFQQLDVKEGSRVGFGLGLSIAQQFAVLHGGTIELESEEGQGCCFTVVTGV